MKTLYITETSLGTLRYFRRVFRVQTGSRQNVELAEYFSAAEYLSVRFRGRFRVIELTQAFRYFRGLEILLVEAE